LLPRSKHPEGELIRSQTDATQAYDLKRMVEAAQKQYGRLDYAVNNAGASSQGAFMDMAVEDFDRIAALNLRGVVLAMQAEIPAMLKSGGGAIVNVSSAPRACGYSRDVFIRSNQMRSDRSHQERSA
jgi:NAD(P)-dependent dehydrogenase (short-subunit alcohol dehydrogenase family)